MSLKINRRSVSVESISVYFLLATVLFSGYIEKFLIWHVLLWIDLIILLILKNGWKVFIEIPSITFYLIIITGMIICNIILSDGTQFIFANIRSISYVISASLILLIISTRKTRIIVDILDRHILFFNIWYIVNLFVLYMQIRKTGFMIKTAWLIKNPYYQDACAGLFGMDSTDIMGYYAAFMLVYNFKYINKNNVKGIKKYSLITFTFLAECITLYCFTLNDGNAFFFLLPAVFAFYLLTQIDNLNTPFRKKIVIISRYAIVFVVALVAAMLMPHVREYVSMKVLAKFNALINFRSVTVLGSNERLAISYQALKNGYGWGLGKGIGYCKWHQPYAFGFRHFGLSSIGSFISIMGIWFYFIYCLMFANFMYRFSLSFKNKRSALAYTIFLIITFIMTIYTFLFTETRTLIMIFFIIEIIVDNCWYKHKI